MYIDSKTVGLQHLSGEIGVRLYSNFFLSPIVGFEQHLENVEVFEASSEISVQNLSSGLENTKIDSLNYLLTKLSHTSYKVAY